jgi:hypothetical protein
VYVAAGLVNGFPFAEDQLWQFADMRRRRSVWRRVVVVFVRQMRIARAIIVIKIVALSNYRRILLDKIADRKQTKHSLL